MVQSTAYSNEPQKFIKDFLDELDRVQCLYEAAAREQCATFVKSLENRRDACRRMGNERAAKKFQRALDAIDRKVAQLPVFGWNSSD